VSDERSDHIKLKVLCGTLPDNLKIGRGRHTQKELSYIKLKVLCGSLPDNLKIDGGKS
jgi:hypothetical protein